MRVYLSLQLLQGAPSPTTFSFPTISSHRRLSSHCFVRSLVGDEVECRDRHRWRSVLTIVLERTKKIRLVLKGSGSGWQRLEPLIRFENNRVSVMVRIRELEGITFRWYFSVLRVSGHVDSKRRSVKSHYCFDCSKSGRSLLFVFHLQTSSEEQDKNHMLHFASTKTSTHCPTTACI